jgi:hypothetical protein
MRQTRHTKKRASSRVETGRRIPVQGNRFWTVFMPVEADLSHLCESDSSIANASARRWQGRLIAAAIVVAVVPFLGSAVIPPMSASSIKYLSIAALMALLLGNLPLYFLSSWGRTKLLDAWPDILERRTRSDLVTVSTALYSTAVSLLLINLIGYGALAWELRIHPFIDEGTTLWFIVIVALDMFLGTLFYFVGFCFGKGWSLE